MIIIMIIIIIIILIIIILIIVIIIVIVMVTIITNTQICLNSLGRFLKIKTNRKEYATFVN